MATVTYALTSFARVKTRLDITVTGMDNTLEFLTYAVTDFLEKFCQRRFKETTYTQELYDGSSVDGQGRKKYLILKNAPVSSITAVQYRAGTRSSPSWTDFLTDDYEPMNNEGMLYFPAGMPAGLQNIRVSYVAGYKIDFASQANFLNDTNHTLPYVLTDLAERLVIRLFKKRESEGRSQETLNNSSINWSELMTDGDWQLLSPYMRTRFV